MSEQKKTPLADFIEGILEGGVGQSLLDFIDYCQSKKMPIRLSSGYLWSVFFKGKRVASIEITVKGNRRGQYTHQDNSWIIHVCYLDVESLAFEEYAKTERLTEIVWANIGYCKRCLKSCVSAVEPGLDRKIAGRMFHQVGVCGDIKFKNPDSAAMDCVKKLMDLRKNHIIAESVKK